MLAKRVSLVAYVFLSVVLLFSVPAAANQLIGKPTSQTVKMAVATGRINVNTADVAVLTHLQGIGEKKAQAIIAYRKQNGPFRSFDDLMEVKGIGPAIIAKNKAVIVFR